MCLFSFEYDENVPIYVVHTHTHTHTDTHFAAGDLKRSRSALQSALEKQLQLLFGVPAPNVEVLTSRELDTAEPQGERGCLGDTGQHTHSALNRSHPLTQTHNVDSGVCTYTRNHSHA